MHESAQTDAWSMALIAVYGLALWALAVTGIVVLVAQLGRTRGRGSPPRRPWV
jgi:hypothetical protein